MTFENRQQNRQRTLARLQLAAQALGLFYLALHGTVVALAYKLTGAGEAFLTLITLGFGDLYWAIQWVRESDHLLIASLAAVSAATCFASWAMRPLFNRWAGQFTAQMLADTATELEKIARQQAVEPKDDAGEDPDGRSQ